MGDNSRDTPEVLLERALQLLSAAVDSFATGLVWCAGPFAEAAPQLVGLAKAQIAAAEKLLSVVREFSADARPIDSVPKKPDENSGRDTWVEQQADWATKLVSRFRKDVLQPIDHAVCLSDADAVAAFHNLNGLGTLRLHVQHAIAHLGEILNAEPARGGNIIGQALGGAGSMERAIVKVVLKDYHDMTIHLFDSIGITGVEEFSQQIHKLAASAVQAAGASIHDTVLLMVGAGALLMFKTSEQADNFARALHLEAHQYNLKKIGKAQRHFRIGVSVGDVVISPGFGAGFNVGGVAVAEAEELAECCKKRGEILITPRGWADLPLGRAREAYSGEKVVHRTPDKRTVAHRKCVGVV